VFTYPTARQDEIPILDMDGDVCLFDSGKVYLHDKGIFSFIEVEFRFPLLGFPSQRRPPRAIDEFVKESVHFL